MEYDETLKTPVTLSTMKKEYQELEAVISEKGGIPIIIEPANNSAILPKVTIKYFKQINIKSRYNCG